MRLVTFRRPGPAGGTGCGRVEGDEVIELPFPDVGALLAVGLDRASGGAGSGVGVHSLAGLDLAPVVPSPGKALFLGMNYKAHTAELGRAQPEFPTLFAKFADAFVGARDPIVLPPESTSVDWEVELAVVIGTTVRRAASDSAALAAVGGYCVCNDVSMRDWQRRTVEFLQGKTWDRSTPLGPWLVTPDEVDHAGDLRLTCTVDGSVVQDGRTSDMVFDVAEIVRYASTIMTLRPGDVISTGTPGGVGEGRTPPVFLRPGQVVRTSIEGIGELVNETISELGVKTAE